MTEEREFTDDFDVVNIEHGNDIVRVAIEFHDFPGDIFYFEIPEEDFVTDKRAIADEVERQLGG